MLLFIDFQADFYFLNNFIIFNNFILLSYKTYIHIFSYFDNNNDDSNNNSNSLILLLFVHSLYSKCIYSNYLKSVRRMCCSSERDRSVSTCLPKKVADASLSALPDFRMGFFCASAVTM